MTLETEVEHLCAENVELRLQAAQLQEQLAAALARIAELEQQLPDPPPFVKPNRLPATEPKPKRKKRASHLNRGRPCEPPTRTEPTRSTAVPPATIRCAARAWTIAAR